MKQINPRKVKHLNLNEGIVRVWPSASRHYTDRELSEELAGACRDNDSGRLLDAFDIERYVNPANSS